jgi:autotransporter translocation and assembly factor TamB
MRKVTIIALVVLLAGAGLWYARVNRRGTHTTGRTITGSLAVSIDGASSEPTIIGNLNVNGASLVANQTGMLQGRFAVEGNLHTRSLPNGELVLEGDVRMRQARP